MSVHVLPATVAYSDSVYTHTLFEIILAVHITAVVVAFGVTFAYPVLYAVAARADPRSLPLLHRFGYKVDSWLVNPGLVLVVAAGIYLASDAHVWKTFYAQWGVGAAIVIGGVVGGVMIPTGKRAEEIAQRDIDASVRESGHSDARAREQTDATPATAAEADLGSGEAPVLFSAEYRTLARRLSAVGSGLSLLVLVTIFFMALKL